VKIYLLLIDHERFFFYSDESEVEADLHAGRGGDGTARSGLVAWLEARLVRFKTAWHHAESGVTHWLRRLWDWLHSWSHPDEWMLSQLRSARKIELHHPASRPGDAIHVIWHDYLRQQWYRHMVWLGINATIAPFTVLFAPLPGPNVIGYWFLYRAIHHLLVVWGIRRVRRGIVATELHPREALDLPVDSDGAGKARHVALEGAGERLDEHVARSRSRLGLGARRSGASRPPIANDSNVPKTEPADSEIDQHAVTQL
jgi:hypothetical protein